MPACTLCAKSRAVSPSRVKMEVPLPYSCSLMSLSAVSKSVDLHLGLDVVEEAGTEEEAFSFCLRVLASVHD
jgi:hypothetical protein